MGGTDLARCYYVMRGKEAQECAFSAIESSDVGLPQNSFHNRTIA
jgi:hypothetical protein